jgi:hypothetical protein
VISRAASVLSVLVLLVAAACTSAEESPSDEPASHPSASASSQAGAEARAAAASLTVRDGGRICVDKKISPDPHFTYGDEILDSSGPVEVESVELVRPRGFEVVEAWLLPSRGIEYHGRWFDWPLPKWVRSGDKLAWHQRQRASGAQLEPGTYNLLVRLRRSPGPEVQGFDALRIEYRSGEGEVDTVETRTPVRFRTECA